MIPPDSPPLGPSVELVPLVPDHLENRRHQGESEEVRGESPPGPGTVLLGSTQTPSAGTKPTRPAGREQQRPPRWGMTFSCEETQQQFLRCTENEPRVLFPCPAWGSSRWARGLPLLPVSAGHAAALPRATGVRPFRHTRSGDEDRRDGACANTREATGGSFPCAEGAHGRRAKAPASSEKARRPLARKRETHKTAAHRLRFLLSNTVSSSLSSEAISMFSS